MDREKVIKGLENCSIQNDFGCQGCPYLESRKQYGHEWCTTELAQDALAMLKEQQEQIDRLLEESASNAEMEEGLKELLKEQEAKTGKWERKYSRPGVYANLFWWCSVCGEPTRYNDAGIFYKYCPRCGAKLEPCIET